MAFSALAGMEALLPFSTSVTVAFEMFSISAILAFEIPNISRVPLVFI
jgi:hypothetical protein